MTVLPRALLEVRRRPTRHIIFFLIFLASFVCLMLGLSLAQTATGARDQVMDIIGPYWELTTQQDEPEDLPIDEALCQTIAALPHVSGVNQNRSEFAIAGNFETVKTYEGEKPDPDPALYADGEDRTPNSVILDMSWDPTRLDDFRLGDSVLLEGSCPDRDHPGLLVEETLMEQNGLHLGDELRFYIIAGRELRETIVGVYRTNKRFVITEHNTVGESVFAWSPYNTIYTTLDVYRTLYDRDPTPLPLKIDVDSLGHMEEVEQSIRALDLDWDRYALNNGTSDRYEYTWELNGQQIERLSSYANIILCYTILIAGVLLILVLNLFLQYYMEDAGILIALGATKGQVAAQYLCSVGAVALAAVAVGAVLSTALLQTVIGGVIQSTTVSWNIISQVDYGVTHTATMEVQHLNVLGWGAFLLGVVLLVLISAFPLLWRLFRYHPRTILARENE